MKVAKLVLACGLAAATGCATGRPHASGSSGSSGSSPIIPDVTPSLGSPAESPTGGSSTFFRGKGPKLPEAFRDDPLLQSPRVTNRWKSAEPRPQVSQYRAGAATAPVSSSEPMSLADEPRWSRFYRSTDRRVIESLELGNGPRRIAIIGSMHGDETQSVALVEELARHFNDHRESLSKVSILLVKSPNPDGLAVRSPYNVHGVDLNRNFPSANWKSLPNSRAGATAGSEAETRVVMRLLSDFRPTLLVHLKDSREQTIINSEGNVGGRADEVARLANGRAVVGLGAKTSGSVEHYATMQLKCPSLTMLLAVEASDQAAWGKNRDVLLAACGITAPPASELGGKTPESHPFDQGKVRNSSLRQNRAPNDESGRTPSINRPSAADGTMAIPDRGYIELPSP